MFAQNTSAIEPPSAEYIHSDNGPEFIAKELPRGLAEARSKTLDIEPARP
jgi:transposase InsO family protein